MIGVAAMTRPCTAGRSSGFTLIELLVALALISVVTLTVLNATRLAASGLDRVTAAADRLQDRHSIEDLLREEIGATIAAPLSATEAPLAGTATQLRLLTISPTSGPGIYRVEIGFDQRDPARPLVLTRRTADAVAGRDIERVVLARRLQGFRIQYFGATTTDGALRWRNEWNEPRFPPQLVSISLSTPEAPARPPVVVRLWSAPGS